MNYLELFGEELKSDTADPERLMLILGGMHDANFSDDASDLLSLLNLIRTTVARLN